MNYRLKYANQFVVSFVIMALIVIGVAIIFVAFQQKIFEKKLSYNTKLSDGTGLSAQTQLLYKGFEIGRVKKFSLSKDGWIVVYLKIYQRYSNLIVTGSVINRLTSPLTGKTQLEFFQNNSSTKLIEEGGLIESSDTPEGLVIYRELSTGKSSDMITSIITNLDRFIQELGKDNNQDKGSLFRLLYFLANVSQEASKSMMEINKMLNEVNSFASNLNKDNNADQGAIFRLLNNAADASVKINKEIEAVDTLIKGLTVFIEEYQNPDSLLVRMIDPSGNNIITPIRNTLETLNMNLKETQQILVFLNRQKPELSILLNQINEALTRAQKTLDALNNNPLLKSGIPPKKQSTSGTGTRIKEFNDDKK